MKRVAFLTLGCKVNQYETQIIREQFIRAGFKAVDSAQKADIYVINTCTVTSSADRKSRYLAHYANHQNPEAKIMVTGCYTELDSDEIIRIPGVTRVIKNRNKYKILEFLNENNEINENNAHDESGISNFSGHTRAFLKIQDGCNNFCSYCKVPLVRGASRSRPSHEIVQETARLVENGFKEIVLCGICLGAYGKDLPDAANLVDLIGALENIEGLLRIRLSSIEAGDVSDSLIEQLARSKKLCRHLHIPVQSGDDEILKKMNRSYSRKDYVELIRKIKSNIPEIAITTDVLVGFPGEGEDNFRNTLDLIREIMPLRVHIFPYSKRPGTSACLLGEKAGPLIIKERIFKLEAVSKQCALVYKKRFLNRDGDVLIEERSPENNKYWQGYTDNYIKVRVRSKVDLKNQVARVSLKKIDKDCIEAVLLYNKKINRISANKEEVRHA